MEEYKDVMLSEPPSRFTAAPAVQSMSLENYKGILLCDRPTVGAVNRVGPGEGPVPFLPAGKGDDRYVGLQPSLESRSRYELSRSMRQNSKVSKPSALTRHKKWLYSFANAVKKMQLDKVERQLEDAESQKKLRDHQRDQRLYRQQTLEAQGTPEGTVNAIDNAAAPAETAVKVGNVGEKPSNNAGEERGEKRSPATLGAPANKPKGKAPTKATKPKPRWAMTEEEALDAELNENDALVEFAQNLSYESFINDFEVREALAIMRDRVKEIAAEQGMDLADVERIAADRESAPSEGSSVVGERPKREGVGAGEKTEGKSKQAAGKDGNASETDRPAWNGSTAVGDKLRSAISHDALALAEKLLLSTPSLQLVHTKQSLARVLQNAAISSMNDTTALRRAEGAANVPYVPPVQQPAVSIVAAESLPTGEPKQNRILLELKKKKDHVQNLPYMYRCPSL